MSAPLHHASGAFFGRAHHFPVRVNFEDTDMTGVVYHPNYLNYMERARSDALRLLDIDYRAAFERGEGYFAIAELAIKYLKPAQLGDALIIVSQIQVLRAVSWLVHQRVMRNDDVIADATITLAFLSSDGRPKRQPKAWAEAYQIMLKEPA